MKLKRKLNILKSYEVEEVINLIDCKDVFSYGYLYEEIYNNRVKTFTGKFKELNVNYYPSRIIIITKKFIIILLRKNLVKDGK